MNYITPNTQAAPCFLQEIGNIITIKGTIYKIRQMRGFAFVLLKQGSALIQCVHGEFSQFSLTELTENMTIAVTGLVCPDPRSKAGFELQMHTYTCLSRPAAPMPLVINGKELPLSLDTLLDNRPLTLRNQKETAIFELQAGICRGLRSFFDANGFCELHSPKLGASSAEGGANVFTLDYFGSPACLAQSPQFYKQMMTAVLGRVYEIAPVFRAEKHHTARHLNEYISVDLEMPYIETFHDIMAMETALLSHTLQFISETCAPQLALLEVALPTVATIPTLPFFEAKKMAARHLGRAPAEKHDFEPEEEKALCAAILEQTGSEFVFVTHYPSVKRPFYAKDTPSNSAVTESFDLLFRGQEITTGGQRIHDYGEQMEKLLSRGMNPEDFSDFLSAHKHGLPPHGGLGLGLERLTARLLNLPNVKQASLFPRDVSRISP